jgi:hypothetical protein
MVPDGAPLKPAFGLSGLGATISRINNSPITKLQNCPITKFRPDIP